MPTTTIEIVDTAVKIGLGSLITLVGTIAVAKLNHGNEKSREERKRYYDSLESIASDIEETTHVALRYWALVIEWVRNYQQKGLGLTDKRQEELEKTKLDLFDYFKNITVAESKLMLLGLQDQATLLREYGEFLKEMRRKYYDGNSQISESDLKECRNKLLQKRESLFKSLSGKYKDGL